MTAAMAEARDAAAPEVEVEAIIAQAAARLGDAALALRLLALDPQGLGGARLRARPGPARDAWMAALRAAAAPGAPWRRLPAGDATQALDGGLDVAATLASGRPRRRPGLLAEAAGGWVIAPMADQMTAGAAGRLAQAQDRGGAPSLLLFDEGVEPDEAAPAALSDRVAFSLDLEGAPWGVVQSVLEPPDPGERLDLAAARQVFAAGVSLPSGAAQALTEAAAALGVTSLRAPLFALSAARAHAALHGRSEAEASDLAVAARLVLAPRAMRAPPEAEPPEEAPEPEPSEPPETEERAEDAPAAEPDGPLPDQILAAVAAALPPDLLARLAMAGRAERMRSAGQSRVGPAQAGKGRGRPVGARRGDPRRGDRLRVIDTLAAAAPLQRLRRAERAASGGAARPVEIRPDDLRVARVKRRRERVAVFVVDASGSQAAARLAEAKGAVERLLAECYVRRDQAALVTFRGAGAELALPPTRSLTRAKRLLAALPGGGGTPLAAGLALAGEAALAARRRGLSPLLVVMTDGRANVGLSGAGGREAARADAERAAQALRMDGLPALVIDTGRRAGPETAALAAALGAERLALPRADSAAVAAAVAAAGDSGRS